MLRPGSWLDLAVPIAWPCPEPRVEAKAVPAPIPVSATAAVKAMSGRRSFKVGPFRRSHYGCVGAYSADHTPSVPPGQQACHFAVSNDHPSEAA